MNEQIDASQIIDTALQLKWDFFRASEHGDNSPDSIHLEVGRSLSQWEMMEVTLGQIYQTLCHGRYSEGLMGAASRTYGLITSPAVRKNVLMEVAEIYSVYVDTEFDLQVFKRLLEHYANASAYRNNLAHGYVSSINVEDEPLGYYLVPAAYITKRNQRIDQWEAFKAKAPKPEFPSMKYLYTSSDIARLREQMIVLARGFGAFHGLLITKSVQMHLERAQAISAAPPTQIRVEVQK